MRRVTLALALGALAALAPAMAAAKGTELAYDDGRKDDMRSAAGGGHVVRFERPTEEFALTAVRLHGSRYGGGYDPEWTLARVRVCDGEMKELAHAFVPYAAWKVGADDWVEVLVGPLRVPPAFFVGVEYFPTQTRGIYQSIDDSSSGHSYGLSGADLDGALDGGEWMIRAVGEKKGLKVERPDSVRVEVLARGEGDPLGKQSMAGTGHAVIFKPPKDAKLLTGFSLYGGRYGAGYDPRRTYFHVVVCDKKLKALWRTAFPYSAFEIGEMHWAHFDLPPLEVSKEFAILVYFEPTQTRGVYVGLWAEEKAASVNGLPGAVAGRSEKGKGWMIQAHCAPSAGKYELPAYATAEAPAEALDALEIAQAVEELDAAEVAEALDEARRLSAKLLAGGVPEQAWDFEASEHYFLRSKNVDEKTRAALLALMECAHDSYTTRFGFERVSAFEKKRIHLHVEIGEGKDMQLFTSPASTDYSLVVLRGEPRALRAPTHGGPHVVYGFCHELGHVLCGWEDSEHQWAHYLGSWVTSDVFARLGKDGWIDPYDYHSLEGLPRFEKEIEGVTPGVGEAAAVASLFQRIGERFGQERYGPAIAWIRANREGKPFSAVRLHRLADLAAALVALGCDEGEVKELFGQS